MISSNTNPHRILITGITSIHGWPVWKALVGIMDSRNLMGICPPKTKVTIGPNVTSMCITNHKHLVKIRDSFQPTLVVHCAGICDLDLCEERPNWAHDINVNGMQTITDVFGRLCPIIYLSTDLVFSGQNPPEQGYAEDHPPDPVSVAGKTFAQAETALLNYENSCIIRLGLPLGESVTGTAGAIDWVKGRLLKGRPVTLFYDELRSCLWCEQIEEMILAVINQNIRGLFHFGGNQSWQLYEIGQYVIKKYGCSQYLLKGISRHEEINGPPRIGDVSLNCTRFKCVLNDLDVTITGFNEN